MNKAITQYTSIITLLFFSWLTVTSEKCDEVAECTDIVIVMDMSDLDGCGMILVNQDDKKLLPVNLDEYPQSIKNGDQLRVSFTILKNGMSTCMAEDAMVTLTCLELISSSPKESDCLQMKDPVDFSWSKKVLGEIEMRHIERFTTDDGDYYMFRADGECRLYKCTGQFICMGTCDKNDECETYFASHNIEVTEARVIYVQDN